MDALRVSEILSHSTFESTHDDDAKIINRLFVKTGTSAGTSTHGNTYSDAWHYFGPLYCSSKSSDDPQAAEVGPVESEWLVDDKLNYCSLCLADLQNSVRTSRMNLISCGQPNLVQFSTTQMTKYSKGTSTSTMRFHLKRIHGVSLSSSSRKGQLDQSRMSFIMDEVKLQCRKDKLCEEAVSEWIALDILPTSAIQNERFRQFFEINLPQIDLPTEESLRLSVLPRIYQELKAKIMDDLTSAAAVCVMLHNWTENTYCQHFVEIRASYIRHDWSSAVVLLSCMSVPGDSQAVCEHVLSELNSFGLSSQSLSEKHAVTYVTHDGSAAMIEVSQRLNSQHFQPCTAHALHQLLMTDGVNSIQEFRELLQRCRDAVTKLYFSGHIVQEEVRKSSGLSNAEELMSGIETTYNVIRAENDIPLKIENCASKVQQTGNFCVDRKKEFIITRWYSAMEILCCMLKHKEQVTDALKRTSRYDDFSLNSNDWEVMSELYAFLEAFKTLTYFDGSSMVGLSVVSLIRAKVLSLCETSGLECEEIVRLKHAIVANVDKHFPMTNFVKVATLLDPASKNKKYLSMTFEQKLSVIASAAKNYNLLSDDKSLIMTCKEICCDGATAKRVRLMDEFEDEDSEGDLSPSVSQYLSSSERPNEEECNNPLLYWKNSKFTVLSAVARIYLTANAACVPSDCMFGINGLLSYQKRASMSPCRVNQLTFIRDNYDIFA